MTQIPLEAENEFYAAMEREDAEQLEREARAAASARLNALALQLKREFSTAESSRKLIEERWLEDLMQYRGQYPADVMERLKKFKRSQVYYRMTTNKVDMMVARLMDLLFPARSKNWAIQPTPDPEIPGELVELSPEFMQAVQEVMAEQMQILQAQNAVPDGLAMRKMQRMAMQEAMRRIDLDTVKLRIAKACADKMEQVIDDQLKESSAGGEFRPSWAAALQGRHLFLLPARDGRAQGAAGRTPGTQEEASRLRCKRQGCLGRAGHGRGNPALLRGCPRLGGLSRSRRAGAAPAPLCLAGASQDGQGPVGSR